MVIFSIIYTQKGDRSMRNRTVGTLGVLLIWAIIAIGSALSMINPATNASVIISVTVMVVCTLVAAVLITILASNK